MVFLDFESKISLSKEQPVINSLANLILVIILLQTNGLFLEGCVHLERGIVELFYSIPLSPFLNPFYCL